ncbi:MAG: hypothetical protein NTZ16_15575 [Verrucomicrobia bacterium]|nr:hypothetical protein [Verrucomicrobiota bacterium]
MQSAANPARKFLLLLAALALCAIPFLQTYENRAHPLDEDEIYWVGQTYYFHLALNRADWANPDWQLLPARENPVLGKYLLGAGLRLAGLQVTNADWLGIFYVIAKDRPNAWGDARDQAERQAVLDRMTPATRDRALTSGEFEHPPAFITAARAIMLLFGMLATVLLFALAALYTHRLAAFLAAAAFALHPAVVAAYTEVGVDILAIAFSLLAVLYFALIERRVWQRSSRPALTRALLIAAAGLALAFAVGSKMNAVVTGFLSAALLLVFAGKYFRTRAAEAKDSALALFAALVLSLIVFVAANPGNYPNPVRGVRANIADQQRSLEVQKGIPAKRKPLRSAGERLRAIATLTAFHPAAFALVVAAVAWLLFAARRAGGAFPLIALWWVIAFAMVTAWLPFARPRYALPVIAPSVILLAIAGGGVVDWLRQRKISPR